MRQGSTARTDNTQGVMRGVRQNSEKLRHTPKGLVRIDVRTTSIGGKPQASAFALAA